MLKVWESGTKTLAFFAMLEVYESGTKSLVPFCYTFNKGKRAKVSLYLLKGQVENLTILTFSVKGTM